LVRTVVFEVLFAVFCHDYPSPVVYTRCTRIVWGMS
jgi:hypothetical protein